MFRKCIIVMAALAALVTPLAAVVATAPPAAATPQLSKWYQTPYVTTDGAHDANVQDGAYYWQDRGFPGYYPPLPHGYDAASRCTSPYVGEILICEVDQQTVNNYSCAFFGNCSGNYTGVTVNYTNQYESPPGINGTFILIVNNLDPATRQYTYRHEMGHALGLGHSTDPSCIMYPGVVNPGSSCYSDVESMQGLYYR